MSSSKCSQSYIMYQFLRTTGLLLLLAVMARAQITETPVTVQPGRFLLKMNAIAVTVDRQSGRNYTGFGAATTFLTTGLTSRWDVQAGAEVFVSQKYVAGTFTDRRSGIGDVYFRTKWRFYESPDNYTTIALLPFVKLPTNSGGVGNHAMEGGLIVPLHTELAGGFSLDAMGEVDFLRNAAATGYDNKLFGSVAVKRSILKAIEVYGEATMGKSTGGLPWAGTVGLGATLHVSADTWWDYAIYRGAADWNHVLRFNYGF
jgi:hypothetical protein